MRMAYMDEAGISNPAHEPHVVVAGVLINADKQWQAVERHLIALADKYAPPGKRDGFYFHATELFSGGRNFPRDQYDRESRWRMLDALLSIPGDFDLPISPGWTERAKLAAKYPHFTRKEVTDNAQAIACAVATFGVDHFMQHGKGVEPDEVASLVMENSDARPLLRSFHNFNRNPRNAETLEKLGFGAMAFKRIIGSPHFEEKSDSSALQIADACAFAIKRHLMKAPESARFYDPIKRMMILLDKSELDAHGRPRWSGIARSALHPDIQSRLAIP